MDKVMDKDKKTQLPIIPRLLDLHLAAIYCSVGERTISDWISDKILNPVPMPGSTLRDKHGRIISRASQRKIVKILIDRKDIDALIDSRKGQES
jgi:hypothetical protein